MEHFLSSIERQAFRMALFSCHDRDDALDLVQDAMCKFVAKYSSKPEEEWKALFYRVLQNKIRDFHRRNVVRMRWRNWLDRNDEDDDGNALEQLADPGMRTPESEALQNQAFARLEQELKQISIKQRQVFLLRAWEGLSVRDTAIAMNCSEGSVKTHYSRAVGQLKKRLGDVWP